MDYGGILSRAWQITSRRKELWVLGFLVALSSGLGAGTNYRFRIGETDWGQWLLNLNVGLALDIPRRLLIAFLAIVLVAFVLWLLALAPRAGLIAAVQQEQGATSLAGAWRAGSRRFWTMAGIGLLALLPIVLLLAIGIVAVAQSLGGSGSGLWSAMLALDGKAVLREAAGALRLGAGLLCCIAALSAVLQQIRVYAERAAVLDNVGWFAAFRRGWAILTDNLAVTIVFWLVLLLIGIAVAALIGAVVALLVIPLLGLFHYVDQVKGPVVLFVFGCVLALLVGALIGSILHTFISATWTLVYCELSRRVSAPPSANAAQS